MPINPRKTRSCSTRLIDLLELEGILRQRAEGDPQRAQSFTGQFFIHLQNVRCDVHPSEADLFSEKLMRTACEEHIRGALGKGEQALAACRRHYESCSSISARTKRELPPGGRSVHRARHPPVRLCAPRRSMPLRSGPPAQSSARRALATRRCWRDRRPRAHATSSNRSAPSTAPPRLAARRPRARSPCPRCSRARSR